MKIQESIPASIMENEAYRNILNLPEGVIPFCLIPVGYPAKENTPIDKWHAERVHFNGY